jgi:hypothetical protein
MNANNHRTQTDLARGGLTGEDRDEDRRSLFMLAHSPHVFGWGREAFREITPRSLPFGELKIGHMGHLGLGSVLQPTALASRHAIESTNDTPACFASRPLRLLLHARRSRTARASSQALDSFFFHRHKKTETKGLAGLEIS